MVIQTDEQDVPGEHCCFSDASLRNLQTNSSAFSLFGKLCEKVSVHSAESVFSTRGLTTSVGGLEKVLSKEDV